MYTIALYYAGKCHQVPPDEYYHSPTLRDINGRTVAMWLAYNGI